MNSGKKLNVDIDGSVNEFKAMLREFNLKRKRIVFRGSGLEFDGYRDFVFDDDASDIDWKASLRAQKLLLKKYKEERDLKIMFIIDVGSNMVFGSTEKIKCEFAAELIAAFADLILTSEDKVGFFLFSDVITHLVDPKGGSKQFQLLVETITNGENYGKQSNLDQTLDFAMNYFTSAINSVILVSDFLSATVETQKKLTYLAHRFETIAIQIRDPLDITLPEIGGEIVLESSGGKQVIVNPKIAKNVYEKHVVEQQTLIDNIFSKSQVDHLSLITDKSFAPPLAQFLKQRIEEKY